MRSYFRFYISFAWCAAIVLAVVQVSGCGSLPSPPIVAVTITGEPANQSTPLDQTATFTVVASGTTPFNYLWSKDGAAITGATGASYTTPAVSPGDSGATFTVTVSNSVDSVTSNPAKLTVGPRSPKSGDLRFQQVDAPSEADQGLVGGSFGFNDNTSGYYSNSTGSPLEIGYVNCYPGIPNDCAWGVFSTPLPSGQSGLTFSFYGGDYAFFDSDLAGKGDFPGMVSPNSVITSLDLEPTNKAYGIAWMQTSQSSGFDLKHEVVSPSAVQAAAEQDAAQSRVVTAVSFDASGQANLLSYGWHGDTTTMYEAKAINAAPQDVATEAINLAAQGYVLTAFGGNVTDGFLLIGTKVLGDTLPRPILVASGAPIGSTAGYAPVAWLTYTVPGNNNEYDVIYEH
ncbi:MAG: immunoglobulin domain-containing protein [Acidobacteriaceae bacterium]